MMDFKITSDKEISTSLITRGVTTFHQACNMIAQLPYGRNKQHLELLLVEGCGTCSTKHAYLKKLADENDRNEIKLMIGVFRMKAVYSSRLQPIFDKYELPFIPEAHCYLKYHNVYYDYTTSTSKPEHFIHELMQELEIQPDQIGKFKVNYHQAFIKDWLNKDSSIKYSFHEVWKIRESSIAALSD